MKIIESYNDFELTVDSKKKVYESMHEQKHNDFITKLLPKGKSVWIDSCGDSYNPNIVAFEESKWKGIFDPKKLIKYYSSLKSPTFIQAINKYINPTSIVMYESEAFRYVTVEEIQDNISYLLDSFNCKLIIYLDMRFIDFNKLKYSHEHILQTINQNFKIHTIDNFKYVLEINQ